MMHGHEKSDSAIVAVKPTNKAEHSAAEQSTAELFAAEPVEHASGALVTGSRTGCPHDEGLLYLGQRIKLIACLCAHWSAAT
jgi:hypothetical protein